MTAVSISEKKSLQAIILLLLYTECVARVSQMDLHTGVLLHDGNILYSHHHGLLLRQGL